LGYCKRISFSSKFPNVAVFIGAVQCPYCKKEIADNLIINEAAAVMGRSGRGAAKARDPKKMSKAGKKGGWPKGRPRTPGGSTQTASSEPEREAGLATARAVAKAAKAAKAKGK
jgi:general stress protein YciG